MLTFLFEQYGYYPQNLKDGVFFINDWEFRLIEIECDDKKIQEIDKYLEVIKQKFTIGPYIIKTRSNEMVSYYDNKRFVLVSVKLSEVYLDDLNKFHLMFKNIKDKINLIDLLISWKTRCEIIEKEGISSLKIDEAHYNENLEIVLFCLGMCQNSIQYLSELIEDYGAEINEITICHKRIENLNSFDFFNPFNYVFDHPLRDFVELYRSDFLKFEDLLKVLEFYNIDYKKASLFMARLLYPIKIFDMLDDIDREKRLKTQFSIEKEFFKIKKIYDLFKEKYNIRPIDWLEF